MADFGPHAGDSRSSFGLLQATPHVTAHTKGSWATQTGVTPDRTDGFYLEPTYFGANSTIRTVLVDIGFGSGPTTLISNLMVCPPNANYTTTQRCIGQHAFFPVSMPPGEVMKARAQSNLASHEDVYLWVMEVSSGLPCVGSVVDTYGADTANSKGTTLTASTTEGTFGSWVELTSSCERIKALMIAVGHGQADWSTYGNQYIAIKLAVGAAASETELLRIQDVGSSSGTGIASQNWLGPYYFDIPPGTRISASVAKQYSSSSQRTVDVILYGIR